MALSAQPSEWSVGPGITHNKDNVAIFRDLHDEVEDIVVHMGHIYSKVRGRGCRCRGLLVCSHVSHIECVFKEEYPASPAKDKYSTIQDVIFVAIVFSSLGNKVFMKLEV